MIIDAHQHFWKYIAADYGWISDGMDAIRRDYLPEDLAAASAPSGVTGSVAVQARQSIEETGWLLSLAAAHPFVRGVVGWVDLRSPRLEAQLDRFSGNAVLRGVRHVVHDEPDDDFILRSDFLRGIGLLARYGLTYDILIFSRHLSRTLQFVRKFPEQPFVIDHIAKPAIREGEFESWRRGLAEVARYPNVMCKLSGMVTEAIPSGWTESDFRPYIESVIELFGPGRVMFGSDWPVCTLEADYGQVFRIVADAIASLTEAERNAILGGTASRFYGLGDSA